MRRGGRAPRRRQRRPESPTGGSEGGSRFQGNAESRPQEGSCAVCSQGQKQGWGPGTSAGHPQGGARGQQPSRGPGRLTVHPHPAGSGTALGSCPDSWAPGNPFLRAHPAPGGGGRAQRTESRPARLGASQAGTRPPVSTAEPRGAPALPRAGGAVALPTPSTPSLPAPSPAQRSPVSRGSRCPAPQPPQGLCLEWGCGAGSPSLSSPEELIPAPPPASCGCGGALSCASPPPPKDGENLPGAPQGVTAEGGVAASELCPLGPPPHHVAAQRSPSRAPGHAPPRSEPPRPRSLPGPTGQVQPPGRTHEPFPRLAPALPALQPISRPTCEGLAGRAVSRPRPPAAAASLSAQQLALQGALFAQLHNIQRGLLRVRG